MNYLRQISFVVCGLSFCLLWTSNFEPNFSTSNATRESIVGAPEFREQICVIRTLHHTMWKFSIPLPHPPLHIPFDSGERLLAPLVRQFIIPLASSACDMARSGLTRNTRENPPCLVSSVIIHSEIPRLSYARFAHLDG